MVLYVKRAGIIRQVYVKIYTHILHIVQERGAAFFVLIDPDKSQAKKLRTFAERSAELGVDALLVGSSLLMNDAFEKTVKLVKSSTDIPVILFPGSPNQVSHYADAILFLSLISGRNPNFLFGDHVIAAPAIKEIAIEPIPTGYMLIESGGVSTTEYISNTRPIPREKPEIAVAHALAAEFLGLRMLYLEAGSGAPRTVPNEMIAAVRRKCGLPIIVGGGITKPETAGEKVQSGADIIVVGNALENKWDEAVVKAFSDAVHSARSKNSKCSRKTKK